MFSYVIRRLLLAIPTLIGMTAAVFFMMALSPGGTAADFMAKEAGMKPQERAAIKAYLDKRYGLNDPYIIQYFRWLKRISPIGFVPADERDELQQQWAREQIKGKWSGTELVPLERIADQTKLPLDSIRRWLDGTGELPSGEWKSVTAA